MMKHFSRCGMNGGEINYYFVGHLRMVEAKKSRFIRKRRGAGGEHVCGSHCMRPEWSHLHSRQGPDDFCILSPIA